ncbi:AAA family ATPase [Microvirga alba]|uniref:AAA family ATPase n=1 Tax=Microvirga alba TaxID=2791025 RepID=A0A931BV99_9HYPH|nr:AAA family ATPase [Microvirga alba]MBF9235349.1 AAA family ATPase [Microvirga alba]
MHLRRIEISNFRKIQHVVIDDLRDGLNVISGDNEAGKSTILAALRAALFERHRVGGEAAAAMLPYNQSVRPEILVDFDLDGHPWKLRKAFCQKAEVELIGPGERHTGDPAEERLAQLFGFTPPGRGASKPQDHQGIYGLLWVEQGASHRALGVGAGRESLASALESEVGQVIGGERGRALLAAAEARRNVYWDRRDTPKPKGDYKARIEEVEELKARKEDVETRLSTYDEKIALLSKKRDILARHERDASLESAVASLSKAQQTITRTKKLETAVSEAAEKRKRFETEERATSDRLDAREKLIKQVESARTALNKAATEADEAKSAFARLETVDKAANDQLVQARAARLQNDRRVTSIEQAINHRRAEDILARLEQQLTTVESADAKRREALATADSLPLDQKQLAKLEQAVDECNRLKARIDAASVQIVFHPIGNQKISIEGTARDPSVPLLLADDSILELEGFGRLTIHPGGGVTELVQSLQDAQHVLQRALQQAGLASVSEAKAEFQRKLDALAEAELQKKLIAASAPKGLEALRQEVETQRVLTRRLATHNLSPTDATDEMLELARQEQNIAAKVEATSEDNASRNRANRETASQDVAVKAERVAAATQDLNLKVGELNAAREKMSDEEMRAAFEAAQIALRAAISLESEAALALDEADPEAAILTLQRAKLAEESIRLDIDKTSREVRDLEVELKALGRDGLGEQLAEIEGELSLKQRQAETKKAEADGARLLYETLSKAQKESKDRWLGPVRERVAPYLKLIQPDSDIVLNEETLEIEKFVRKGVDEPFEGLSIGAREQAAVITRLALADILRGSGQPSVVILDDALVNTDEQRLDRMHLVLHKAASALQILILTCRERDFLQLGAPIRRI